MCPWHVPFWRPGDQIIIMETEVENPRSGLPKDPWGLPAWDVGQRLQAVLFGLVP